MNAQTRVTPSPPQKRLSPGQGPFEEEVEAMRQVAGTNQDQYTENQPSSPNPIFAQILVGSLKILLYSGITPE